MKELFKKYNFILVPGIPMFIMGIWVIVAIFTNYLTHIDPNQGNLYNQFIPPAWMPGGTTDHLLGTDYYGRDNLARLMYGARISLSIALIVTLISGTFGAAVGLLAGYEGGIIDSILMRVVDGWLSFPIILIAILLAVVVGPSYFNVIFILSLLFWPNYARQVRGEALVIKEQDYVASAKVAGSSRARIMFKHILPNVVPTLTVIASFGIAQLILTECMLSFLGAGVPPPSPSWGSMAAEGRDYIGSHWWLTAFPGFTIFLIVLSINLIGDWIRDRLDPRLRQL